MQTIAQMITETVKLDLMRANAELEYQEQLASLKEQQEAEVPLTRHLIMSVEEDISFFC